MKFNRQVVLSGLILVCLTILIHLPVGGKPIPLRKSFEDFPTAIGQWECYGHNESNMGVPELVGAHSYLMRKYENCAGREITLYVDYLGKQAEGEETIMDVRHHLVDGENWQIAEQAIDWLELPDHPKNGISVNRCIIENGGRKRVLLLYWYQIGSRSIAGKYRAKAWLILNTVFKGRRDGALIYLSTPMPHSADADKRYLADFAKLIIPVLANYLPN